MHLAIGLLAVLLVAGAAGYEVLSRRSAGSRLMVVGLPEGSTVELKGLVREPRPPREPGAAFFRIEESRATFDVRVGETILERLTLEAHPEGLYLHVVGGRPVEGTLRSGGREYRALVGPAAAEKLSGCDGCGAVVEEARCPRCGRKAEPLASCEGASLEPIARALPPSACGKTLFLLNPYAADLWCRVTSPGLEWEFTLAARSARPILIPGDPKARIGVRAFLGRGGAQVDDGEATLDGGPGLYTVGGATLYRWVAPDRTYSERILPGRLVTLASQPQGAVLLPAPQGQAKSRALLMIEKSDGRSLSLYPVVSAPLISPVPAPLPELTCHPNVQVTELVLPPSLRGKVVSSVAADRRGLIVLCEGMLYDASTGKPLNEGGPVVASAALARDGVLLLTRQALVGTIRDGGIVTGKCLEDPTFFLRGTGAAPGGLLLFGGRVSDSLLALTENGLEEAAPGSPAVTAVGEGSGCVLVARGRRIDAVRWTGARASSRTILELPDGPPVIGLHDQDGILLFSTAGETSMLVGDVVLPVVVGIGGPLYPCREGVLLHDRATRRIFVLSGSFTPK